MKKILLLSTLLAAATLPSMAKTYQETFPSASEIPSDFIDNTPKFFKFFDKNSGLTIEKLLRTDIESPANANLGNSKDSFITGKGHFSEEQLANGGIVFGGTFKAEANRNNIAKAFSTYDFGGKIGRVLVINGINSNFETAIKDKFGLEEEVSIPKPKILLTGNLQLFWVLNYTLLRDGEEFDKDNPTYLRVRVELNAYNNDMQSDLQALTSIMEINEEANWQGADQTKPIEIKNFANREGETSDPSDFNSVAKNDWNPYRWMVYEFDVQNNYAASYLRTFFDKNKVDFDNGTLLIRSIEIYKIPQGYSDIIPSDAPRITWNDYGYGNIYQIDLTHNQGQGTKYELSANDIDYIHFNVKTVSGRDFNPETTFEAITVNDDNSLVDTEINNNEIKLSIDASAPKTSEAIKIAVKTGDVTSNEVELHLHAAPAQISLSTNTYEDDKAIYVSFNDEKTSFPVSILDANEGTDAYQDFNVDLEDESAVGVAKEGNNIVFTPNGKEEKATKLTLTALTAGKAKSVAAVSTFADEPTAENSGDVTKVYNVYVNGTGTSGIDDVKVEEAVDNTLYNLQGIRVTDPAPGIYIRAGKKVMIK